MTALQKETTKTGVAKPTETRRVVIPQYHVKRKEESFEIVAFMPGVSESNLDLTLDGDWLKIKGSSDSIDAGGLKTVYSEFAVTDYEADFKVPNTIDRENISARLHNGVLSVALAKATEHRSRTIKINAS